MSLRVLVVDDEPAARERLLTMLEVMDVEVVGAARDGMEALALAGERRPDLLLLDIAMPEIDGFDVARHLKEPRPLIVFQTAHSEHALRAFEVEALDYVVKPVALERLQAVLERARRRVEADAPAAMSDAVLRRIQSAVTEAMGKVRPRILVNQGTGYRLIPLKEVVRFSASEGASVAHLKERRFDTDYSLTELEQRTAGSFVRASRSELVAIDHVERFERHPDGTATLRLDDGTRIHVSRRRASDVERALEE